jgi:hemoglobin/transferrin/lactoferrin receptor protein
MKLKISILLLVAFSIRDAQAQTQEQKDSIKNVSLNEVVISGNKFSERKKFVIQKVDIISAKEMVKMNAQSTADVLTNTGQVFVQKSQQGGGSPVIRGFEASRIQINIDGIRYNNAIFRTGHLQNVIAVDHNALQQVEVLNGPASTIHGSDALGGVIMLKTKDPKFSKSNRFELTGANTLMRYSSANQEKTVGGGITFGNNRFASLTQLTFSQFDDLIQGKNGVDSIMKLWKKPFIVERINGTDSMVKNPDPYKQVATGYSQFDLLQKFSILQGRHVKHGINLQMSNSTNIPRYDRLSETSGGIAKNAEWYYGPQFRTLAAYQFDAFKLKTFFNDVTFNLNHQFWEESRHNRSYKKTVLNHRTEKIHALGYNFALRHKDEVNELTIGTDAQLNFLNSTAYKEDIVSGAQAKIDTRYPDGKNNMNLFGVFFQHVLKLDEDRVVMNDGIRFNYTTLDAHLIDTAIQFRLPFNQLSQTNKAVTGNLGIAYMPTEELRLSTNFSSGFRSPNFDDMTKVFESVSGQRLIVPNADLKPEYTKNVDAGVRFNDGVIDIEAYGFYTHFTNAIVTDVFTFNGQDSVNYEGTMTKVYASQNKAKAFIYGGGFSATYRPALHFSLFGSINYTYGRFNNDTVLVPLDHIPPVTGRLGIKYDHQVWYTELYSLYNGRKKLVDYNPAGEDNIQYSTPTGTPSWYTVNFRAGVTFAKHVQLQAGVENILDKNYRYFASGMSAPGRNFVLAVRYIY